MLVFATIFVCGGGYTAADVDNWLAMMAGEKTAVITVGNCGHLGARRPTAAYNIPISRPSVGNGHARCAHLHNKNFVWKLPYRRVAYYDLDVVVKPPVNRCALMCNTPMCAVRGPWLAGTTRRKTAWLLCRATNERITLLPPPT